MTETVGTPITRSGGYLVRIGWKAEGFSVDAKTEGRYRAARIALTVLAIFVGVGVALFGEWLLFQVVNPIIRSRYSFIVDYPSFWQLVIYGLTFVCGWVVYRFILARVGSGLVKGAEKRDDGYSLIEQRRRAAFSKTGEFLFGFLLLAGWIGYVFYAAEWSALQLFILLLLLARIGEGFLFKFMPKPSA